MKNFLFLFLVPLIAFSQTPAERAKIASSYDQSLISSLKLQAAEDYNVQQKLINDYKIRYSFSDSEKKSLFRIENGLPIFIGIYNQGSSSTIGTNKMYPGGSMGLSVTGAGMTAGVWDGGKVRDTHNEFGGGKVTLSDDASTLSNHATHVTGTIIATGVSALRKGIAYGGQAKTYYWDNDYTEMLAFGSGGYLVSNHSYGYIAGDLPTTKFGQYDVASAQIDNVSNANPYYQVVMAAGNDRDDFTVEQVSNKGGYDLLTGRCNSKNGIVVAAVEQVNNYLNPSSVVMSSFSNFGPPDDGRIKPDIAAKGVAVNSCISSTNASYDIYQGTSMASPAISGLVLMLQKHFNNLNASTFMRASTVRGLICHSAKEAGLNPGPDYEFGWGLADAEAAANIITNRNVSTVLEENTLTNAQTFTKVISISSAQKLSATICWTDPTGSQNSSGDQDNRAARLRNNLDLKILKDGEIYYPWRLEVEDPQAPATNYDDNEVDNIEKVEIPNAQPGVYTIQVTNKGNLVGGSQVFSLIASAGTGLTLNNRDYDYNSSIFIYPNPAASILNFEVKNNIAISAISINDISGKEIYKNSNLIGNSIDISNLASGVYFVTFKSDNSLVTKKFIKE